MPRQTPIPSSARQRLNKEHMLTYDLINVQLDVINHPRVCLPVACSLYDDSSAYHLVCKRRCLCRFCIIRSREKMKKTYDIENGRSLKIAKKNDELRIEEKGSNKSATFTPSRWASFLLCLHEIDNQLEKLSRGEDVAYRNHYGGCLLYTSPSPRDRTRSRMPSSA